MKAWSVLGVVAAYVCPVEHDGFLWCAVQLRDCGNEMLADALHHGVRCGLVHETTWCGGSTSSGPGKSSLSSCTHQHHGGQHHGVCVARGLALQATQKQLIDVPCKQASAGTPAGGLRYPATCPSPHPPPRAVRAQRTRSPRGPAPDAWDSFAAAIAMRLILQSHSYRRSARSRQFARAHVTLHATRCGPDPGRMAEVRRCRRVLRSHTSRLS
jgi:hypothetical protein